MTSDVGHLYVDIDGPNKGKNQFGTDLFYFRIVDNTVVPRRQSNMTMYLYSYNIGDTLSGWIIDYDNMDYLKLKDKKCPNGTTPTDENPRCK